MKATIAIIGFWGILYSSLKYDFKNQKIKNFTEKLNLHFKIHCRKVLYKDFKYSLNSVAYLLIAVFICLMIISCFIQIIGSDDNPYLESLAMEMGVIFFMLYLGAKSYNHFKKETKEAFIGSLKVVGIGFLIYNAILILLGNLQEATYLDIIKIESIYLVIFAFIILALFLYLKFIPFLGFHGITLLYRKITNRCYIKQKENPLGHFFRYIGVLVFIIGIIQKLIMIIIT